MQLRVLKSKLHMATATQTRLDYHGSLTLDPDLMDAVGIVPYEAVLVANCASGARAETYVIVGERGSRDVQPNGAMARLIHPGDRLIILTFASLEPSELEGHRPKVAVLDENNRIVESWEG